MQDWKSHAPNGMVINQQTIRGIHNQKSQHLMMMTFRKQGLAYTQYQTRTLTERGQRKLRSRKYMVTKKEWENAEMTFYARLNDEGIVVLMDARILNYSPGLDPNMMMNPCEGTTLHTNLYPGWQG